MSESELFFSLLRVSATQILRAAGLTTAKPSVIDAFTGTPPPSHHPTPNSHTHPDILARYLLLLGSTTRDIAESSGRLNAELDDVRLALEHVGLVRPLNVYSDGRDEDTRGVDGLVEWFRGGQAAELRRVAGYGGGKEVGVLEGAGVKNEEWVAALRKIAEKRAREGLS